MKNNLNNVIFCDLFIYLFFFFFEVGKLEFEVLVLARVSQILYKFYVRQPELLLVMTNDRKALNIIVTNCII